MKSDSLVSLLDWYREHWSNSKSTILRGIDADTCAGSDAFLRLTEFWDSGVFEEQGRNMTQTHIGGDGKASFIVEPRVVMRIQRSLKRIIIFCVKMVAQSNKCTIVLITSFMSTAKVAQAFQREMVVKKQMLITCMNAEML